MFTWEIVYFELFKLLWVKKCTWGEKRESVRVISLYMRLYRNKLINSTRCTQLKGSLCYAVFLRLKMTTGKDIRRRPVKGSRNTPPPNGNVRDKSAKSESPVRAKVVLASVGLLILVITAAYLR